MSACYKEAERRVDLVVALHACGALSDVAVAQAVRHKAGFVVCPCCFNANQFLRVPVEIPPTEDPAEAPAALASSSASVPVSVSAADWLGLPAASLAALLAAADLQGDHAAASEAEAHDGDGDLHQEDEPVEVRVLVDFDGYVANDVAIVDATEIHDLVLLGRVDPDERAVAYARSLRASAA